MGRKFGGLCPFGGEGAGSPLNTMWPGPRLTCMPSFILIRPTVWPECTNVTDRQDRQDRTARQRSDSIGRTVLQTVAQKGHSPHPIFGPCLLWPNGWKNQDATSYGGKPRPRRRCVGLGSQLHLERAQPPVFGPCLLWPKGWMDRRRQSWY